MEQQPQSHEQPPQGTEASAAPGEDLGAQLQQDFVSAGREDKWNTGLGAEDLPAEVPLSFGEQLVLETYLRSRQRPYCRKRQEELAQPRRRFNTNETPVGPLLDGSASRTTDKEKVAEMVNRLTQPKMAPRGQAGGASANVGEAMVLRSLEASRAKREEVSVAEVVQRLSAPRTARPSSPTSGERVVMLYNSTMPGRSVNLDRVRELAQPMKRGNNCRSWGVHPEWVASSTGGDTPRDSSRGNDVGGSGGGSGASGGLRAAGGHIAGGQSMAVPRQPARGPAAAASAAVPAGSSAASTVTANAPAASTAGGAPEHGQPPVGRGEAFTDPSYPDRGSFGAGGSSLRSPQERHTGEASADLPLGDSGSFSGSGEPWSLRVGAGGGRAAAAAPRRPEGPAEPCSVDSEPWSALGGAAVREAPGGRPQLGPPEQGRDYDQGGDLGEEEYDEDEELQALLGLP